MKNRRLGYLSSGFEANPHRPSRRAMQDENTNLYLTIKEYKCCGAVTILLFGEDL